MADKQLGLSNAINNVINDPRNKNFTKHEQLSMLKQRIYSIASGYEDLKETLNNRKTSGIRFNLVPIIKPHKQGICYASSVGSNIYSRDLCITIWRNIK